MIDQENKERVQNKLLQEDYNSQGMPFVSLKNVLKEFILSETAENIRYFVVVLL